MANWDSRRVGWTDTGTPVRVLMDTTLGVNGLHFESQSCESGPMNLPVVPSDRVSARRLAELLGAWRAPMARHAAADLAGGVRLLAQEGRLPAGTRLPAERELADALMVSRTLVTAAMDLLRTSGVIASRRGAGSWITVPDQA